MYLHLTSDTTGHEPNIGLDFRSEDLHLDARISLASGCVEEDCPDQYPETIILALRHVAADDLNTPVDVRDEYVPTLRMMLSPENAALAVAIWTRFLAEERPELLAAAMDRAAATETIRKD